MPSESIRPSQPGASALQSLSGESRPSTRRAGFGQGLHATSPRRIVPKLARGSALATACQFYRNGSDAVLSITATRRQHPFHLRFRASIHCRSIITVAEPLGQHVRQPPRFDVGGDLQATWPNFAANRPPFLGMCGSGPHQIGWRTHHPAEIGRAHV